MRAFADLILCDSLYFNTNTFRKVRQKGAHILIKGSNPEFRAVLQDAKFLFEHNVVESVETDSGYDNERLCHWSMKKASGEFAGYPIQIAHLVEDYPKRTKNAHCESWIVSTDLSLSSLSFREAAHLRWHIENNVFKRISHLDSTKRFYIKRSTSVLRDAQTHLCRSCSLRFLYLYHALIQERIQTAAQWLSANMEEYLFAAM